MFRRILVGYIDDEHGNEALTLGQVLARATGAELAKLAATEEGEGLAQLARNQDSDLIVLGPTHRGPISRVVPGATVEHLLGEAPCTVAVAPPGFGDGDDDAEMRVIGVAYDASPAAKEALRSATQLALSNGAALRVYAVADALAPAPVPGSDSHHTGLTSGSRALRDALHEAVAGLPSEARALPVFLRGDPGGELIKAAKVGVDLLVLGSRGGGPVRRMLHHSVTSRVIQAGTVPVLISPAGVTSPPAEP
jgi:nucleotide-binding universal stress UspA family protein